MTDAAGTPIGAFRKDFAKSLLRSTWHLDAAGISAVGQERNQALALGLVLMGLVLVVNAAATVLRVGCVTADPSWSARTSTAIVRMEPTSAPPTPRTGTEERSARDRVSITSAGKKIT